MMDSPPPPDYLRACCWVKAHDKKANGQHPRRQTETESDPCLERRRTSRTMYQTAARGNLRDAPGRAERWRHGQVIRDREPCIGTEVGSMTTLFSSLLATALVVQLPGETIQGKVVDDQGKPVADAQVFYVASLLLNGRGDPLEVATTTDAEGQYHLAAPSPKRSDPFLICAYRPGSAIAAKSTRTPPFDLVLRKSQPRTVKVEGPDGHPVLGAIVSPRFFTADPSRGHGEVPEALIRSLAVTTGPDGTATLKYLAAGEKLVTVRLTAAAIGTQDLQLLATPFLDNQGAMITIRLKPTRRLAGRVRNRSGKPVAGQEVEVWSKGGAWLRHESGRIPGWPPAHRSRRHVPDARKPAGRFVVSGSDPRTGFRADLVEMDHDRRADSAPAAHAPAASATPSVGVSSTGRASHCPMSKSFSRAMARSGPRREPTATAGSRWGDSARGRCFSSHARMAIASSAG